MAGEAGGRAPARARARDPPQAPAQAPRSERGGPLLQSSGKSPRGFGASAGASRGPG